MFDKLISAAQSVLESQVEGAVMESPKVVLSSDTEGYVEFIGNGKQYRLDFEKVDDNNFNLSDKAVEVTNTKTVEIEIEDEEEADMEEDATSSNEEESMPEMPMPMEEEKSDYGKQIEEMKSMYDSKMGEMQTQIDELKMCTDKLTKKMGSESNQKPDEAKPIEPSTEEMVNEKSATRKKDILKQLAYGY